MYSDQDSLQLPDGLSDSPGNDSSHLACLLRLQHEIRDLMRFRAVMDSCDDAIFIIDADTGRIVDVSGSACRRLGFGRDALLGLSFSGLLEGGARDALDRLRQGLASRADCVTTMRGNGNVKVPVEIIMSMARFDGRAFAVATARDSPMQKCEEEKLRALLHEKEVILKEIHHRVKNNLQVISSLLSIQSTLLADPRDVRHFQESRDRIRTMALVHEKLYQSNDLARIDFGPYVERLVANLFRSYTGNGGRVNLSIDIKDVSLNPDQAVPCGLIVNELVTNALKYAFPCGRDGTVIVAMQQDIDYFYLIISDDGIGMPAGFNLAETESLGLQLVNMLASQLDGSVTMDASQGTRFTIRFRKQADKS